MPLPVSDLASNAEENIAHAATILGRSPQRLKVFDAIYTGKQKVKTAAEISTTTHLGEKRVLEEGKKLSDNHLVTPTKIKGRKAYEKIDFFHSHKKKIITLAASPAKLRAFPTKRQPHIKGLQRIQNISIPRRSPQAIPLTIDDIDSFKKVRTINGISKYTEMSETKFKSGIAEILNEKDNFKDWGGENRDLFSTRLVIDGKRYSTAIAFKGPGKKGRLTPGKMGKNGDQIQRLFKCPADVFLVQYWAQIDDAVLEQLEKFSKLKSFFEDKRIRYGIIDGIDSTRLISAYPRQFKQSSLRGKGKA